jgi:hypothetical protein
MEIAKKRIIGKRKTNRNMKNKGQEPKVDSYGGILRIFSLTKRGIDEVREMLSNPAICTQYEIIQDVKKNYNSMSVVELVEYTHNAYAEYVGKRY